MPRRSSSATPLNPSNPDLPKSTPRRKTRASRRNKQAPADGTTLQDITDIYVIRGLPVVIHPAGSPEMIKTASAPPRRTKKPKRKPAGKALVVRNENLPVAGPQQPAAAVEVGPVFYPPAVIAASRQRSFAADLRFLAIRLTIRTARLGAAAFAALRTVAGNLLASCRRIRTVTSHHATGLRPRLDPRPAFTALSSFGRRVARPIFVIGRVAAVVVPCLAIYAAFAMTPAGDPTGDENAKSVTANLASMTPVVPEQTAAAPVRSATSEPVADMPENVKIVDAPVMKAACGEQTWPYVTQRCLAARDGRIDLTTDPDVTALNAARNAMASADPKPEIAGKVVPAREVSKPVKTRKARRERRRHR